MVGDGKAEFPRIPSAPTRKLAGLRVVGAP